MFSKAALTSRFLADCYRSKDGEFGSRFSWKSGSNRNRKWGLIIRCQDDVSASNLSKQPPKDLSSLPKPLSVSNSSASPFDSSKVRVAFKGLPGAYSEDAALKAYPQCETVPCEEFEDALKAVELLSADKAVLPIENSLRGSIHRNYDLLLRHRLHIVGEVQLPVNFCLLALPGVSEEKLKRVLSHPQAFSQSDKYLTKLGIIRENVDDTAAAAQVLHAMLQFQLQKSKVAG